MTAVVLVTAFVVGVSVGLALAVLLLEGWTLTERGPAEGASPVPTEPRSVNVREWLPW